MAIRGLMVTAGQPAPGGPAENGTPLEPFWHSDTIAFFTARWQAELWAPGRRIG